MIWAMICTDGSTIPNVASAAAMSFVEDDILRRELWQVNGAYWPMPDPNNHSAELSGIDRAIRSPPVSVNTHIPTDSMASKKAVERALSDPFSTSLLRMAGRPYILSIVRAVRAKARTGASTRITHVRSHTGRRDRASLGNSSADRACNWQAHDHENVSPVAMEEARIQLMRNELPYCLFLSTWEEGEEGKAPSEDTAPVHGDVRAAVGRLLRDRRAACWASRASRGRLARDHWQDVKAVIKRTWRDGPDSHSLAWALRGLNNVTMKSTCGPQNTWAPSPCDRCGTGHHRTFVGDLHCPANNHIWNKVDDLNSIDLQVPEEDDLATPCDLTEAVRVVAGSLRRSATDWDPARCIIHLKDSLGFDVGRLDVLTDLRAAATAYILNPKNQPPTNPPADAPPATDLVPANLNAHSTAILGRITDLLGPQAPDHIQAPRTRDACRAFLRVYSDLLPPPPTDPAMLGTRWRAVNHTDELLGGTLLNEQDFMSNSYTWVTLAPPRRQPHLIQVAAGAVAHSPGRARVVLLLSDTPTIRLTIARVRSNERGRGNRPYRTHILATLGLASVDLSPSIIPHPDHAAPPQPNTEPLLLLLIETTDMPDTDLPGLQSSLGNGVVISPPPWDRGNPPTDGPDWPLPEATPPRHTLHHTRNHPLLRPRLNWYRSDIPMVPRKKDCPPPSPADGHDRTLGSMGQPPNLKTIHPTQAQNPPFIPNSAIIDKISLRVHHASQEALRKSESWYKWKRKHTPK